MNDLRNGYYKTHSIYCRYFIIIDSQSTRGLNFLRRIPVTGAMNDEIPK